MFRHFMFKYKLSHGKVINNNLSIIFNTLMHIFVFALHFLSLSIFIVFIYCIILFCITCLYSLFTHCIYYPIMFFFLFNVEHMTSYCSTLTCFLLIISIIGIKCVLAFIGLYDKDIFNLQRLFQRHSWTWCISIVRNYLLKKTFVMFLEALNQKPQTYCSALPLCLGTCFIV